MDGGLCLSLVVVFHSWAGPAAQLGVNMLPVHSPTQRELKSPCVKIEISYEHYHHNITKILPSTSTSHQAAADRGQ